MNLCQNNKMRTILILILTLFISCNKSSKKVNLDSDKISAFFKVSLDDTLEISKSSPIELKFNHFLNPNLSQNTNEYTLVDCCLVFTTKDRLKKYKNDFESFCDTIYMPKIKVNDTAKVSFNFKPTIKGENIFLVKITEKTFLEPHKDSIRQIVNDYFFEKDFFVK